MRLSREWRFVFFFILISVCVQAQSEFQKYKALYPDEISVVINNQEKVLINQVGDSLEVFTDRHQEIFHLTDQSNYLSDGEVYDSELFKLQKIEAKTLVPTTKENKYKEILVKEFKKHNRMSPGVFFDDSEQLSFVYPSVVKGAKTVLNQLHKSSQARFPLSYYFSEGENLFSITYPENVSIKYSFFYVDTTLLTKTVNKNKGKITVSWASNKFKHIKKESQSPNSLYFTPHVIVYIEKLTLPKQTIFYGGNLDVFYKYYYSLVNGKTSSTSDVIQKTVDSLTRNCTSQEQKIKNIFYWVQDNIRYVAFENGMEGLIPRAGEKVFEKRYGDCKDMASVICTMLNKVGIESYLTLVGSRDIPYTFDENPSFNTSNHMIASAIVKDSVYYLDATGIYIPFGFPTDMIQGKQVLMAKSSSAYLKKNIPEVLYSSNLIYDSVIVDMKDKALIGKGFIIEKGFSKYYLVLSLRNKNKNSEKTYLESFLQKGNNKFFINDYQISGLRGRDSVASIVYDFKVDDYVQNIDNEKYVNLNLDKILKGVEPFKDRKLPVEQDFKYVDEFVVVLKSPENYILESLPVDYVFTNQKFSFSVKYSKIGNDIKLKRTLISNYLYLYPNDFEAYNEMLNHINKAYKEVVTFKRK